jgi:hypothetical protein
MEPIKPIPPQELPTQEPDLELPHDGQKIKDYIMNEKLQEWKKKTIFRSRTIISVAVSILGFVLVSLLGLDINLGEFISAADGLQVGEAVLALGAVVAAFFRKNAKADLSQPSDG